MSLETLCDSFNYFYTVADLAIHNHPETDRATIHIDKQDVQMLRGVLEELYRIKDLEK